MAMEKLKKFDHPIVFAFAITFVVFGMASVMSWGLAKFHMTGPLGVLKGGVVQ